MNVAHRLDQAGARMTGPRRRLAALVGRQDGPFSASDLLAAAQRDGLGVGRATVFRTLGLLEAQGAVERIDLPSGDHAYVVCARGHHHHAVCVECGRVTDLPEIEVGLDLAELERRSGFEIEAHRLELFGRCPACRRRPRD
jgi:Fur family ferric uptake transcriptional regulator